MVMTLDWSFLIGHQKWRFGLDIYGLHNRHVLKHSSPLREAASDGEPRDGEGCAEAPLPCGDAVAGIDGGAVAEDPAPGEAVGGSALPVGEGRAEGDVKMVVES